MPLNADAILAAQLPPIERTYSSRDCILYALGVGLGYDPVNEDELAFVYEKNLKVLPTFAVVPASDYSWMLRPEFGLTWSHIVHGEETIVFHAPIPPQGTVIGRERVVDVVDKGEGKGALLFHERSLVDKATGAVLATMKQTTFCRADGGFGGARRDTPASHPIPDRAPDFVCDLPTRPEMALIYSLSGDNNPLHAEPAFARAAGFPRPILHGLATMGVACHALLKTMCGYDPARLASMAVRFSAPVFPGETIQTEIWRDSGAAGAVVSFRARVKERDVIAINNGRAEVKK